MPPPLRVASLHRYPVKSLTGESVQRLELDARGVVGDRVWAVRTADGGIGSGKRTRRFRAVSGLLLLRAVEREGRTRIVLPDGSTGDAEDPTTAALLSRLLGQPVTLQRETDDASHHDDGPVSLLSLASTAAVEAEAGRPAEPDRFRTNVVLTADRPYAEDALLGREVRLGSAVLRVTLTSPRCVMVDAETAELPAAPGLLQAVGRAHGACLGVIADVVEPGTVSVGDELR